MTKEEIVRVTFRMRKSIYHEVKMKADKDKLSFNAALHQRIVRDLEREK